MQRANKWRIRDEEEFVIALTYLQRSFVKSPTFWEGSSKKDEARKALQPFDDTLPIDEIYFNKLNNCIDEYLNANQLKKLRVAMRVGKSRNRHKRTQVTLDKEVHQRLSVQSKELGLNLSQTVSLLLNKFQEKER